LGLQTPDEQEHTMSTITRDRATSDPAGLSRFHRTKIAFLVAGFASLVLSVALWATGRPQEAIFVGLWVPAIHSLGALVLTGERGPR
jgi:hypothetical protein